MTEEPRGQLDVYCPEIFHDGLKPVRAKLSGHRGGGVNFWIVTHAMRDDLVRPLSTARRRDRRPGVDTTTRWRIRCNCGVDLILADRIGVGFGTLKAWDLQVRDAALARIDREYEELAAIGGSYGWYEADEDDDDGQRRYQPIERAETALATSMVDSGRPDDVLKERHLRNFDALWKVFDSGCRRLSIRDLDSILK